MSPDPTASPATTRKNVLLYDGECGLCNAVVRFLLRRDRRKILRFSPLQGPTSQIFLGNQGMDTAHFASLVFVEDLGLTATRYWLRTDAVLQIVRRLGGLWKFWLVFAIVPRSWRDALYRVVARTRYRLFRECPRVPFDADSLSRFVDPPE